MATEKRLIDANAEIATIKENVCKNCNSYDGVRCRACWVDDAISFLEDAPTVDATEVVRCKDCKKWKYDANFRGCCTEWNKRTLGNHFCSYGERRTDHVQ